MCSPNECVDCLTEVVPFGEGASGGAGDGANLKPGFPFLALSIFQRSFRFSHLLSLFSKRKTGLHLSLRR
jgi:hypothetical protein